ncbi:MAG: hypothetical protein ACKVOB_04225 [Sphingomonas sp.]
MAKALLFAALFLTLLDYAVDNGDIVKSVVAGTIQVATKVFHAADGSIFAK